MSGPVGAEPEPNDLVPRGAGSPLIPRIGLAVAVAALALLVREVAFYVDDAFITFRYARNWSEWGTPLFNSFELKDGLERAEGYSNFLWMALLRVLHGAGLDLVAVTPFVQLGLGVATLILLLRSARGDLELGPVGAVAAPLVLATAAPFVCWTTGGMETGLFTLLLTSLFLGANSEANRPRAIGVSVAAALVTLVRVEGLAWVLGSALAIGAATLVARKAVAEKATIVRRRLVIAVAAGLAAFAIQLIYRRAVYGHWVPTTVTAKTGGGGTEVIERGLRQVASWGLVTLTPIFAVLLAPMALRHRSPGARFAALAGLGVTVGFVAYNAATGGDWMPFFRFLAPVTPLLALLIATGLDRLPSAAGWGCLVAVLATQPLALFDIHVAPESTREALRFRSFKGGYRSERARIDTARLNTDYFGQLGKGLAAHTEPGEVLAFGAIGSPGWYAKDLDFLDRNGLVTPIVARREVERGEGTAGHEKRVPHAFFLDQGEPQPKWLFAKVVPALIGDPGQPSLAQAKALIRQDGIVGKKPERALFERTVLRTVPMREGPAAGWTLLLLERAEPEAANAFWR
ncbi:MAG: hypothetical protein AAGG01_03840 [Planctomycetota bacterium]